MKIIADHLSYSYEPDNKKIEKALDDVSFVVGEGELVGIIGHTGSGKSTLTQLLNALIKPTSGTIYYEGDDIFDKKYDRKKLRGKVGLVFQYPEHQLFADTVFEDVCFGPKNMGMDDKTAQLKAFEALKVVGMEEDYFYQSPFNLSGGQKRRVAIAGVLAMHPEVLILDEPTAGLDPQSREELLIRIRELRDNNNMTILLVSHSMEDVAEYADRIIVFDKGKKVYDDIPSEIFKHFRELEEIGLKAPESVYLINELIDAGIEVDTNAITMEATKQSILKALK